MKLEINIIHNKFRLYQIHIQNYLIKHIPIDINTIIKNNLYFARIFTIINNNNNF